MRRRSHLRQNRRGATLVLAAFFMICLLAMIAFAVDVGYVALARSQLQNAADASAMAAAGAMGSSQSVIVAEAKKYGSSNKVGSQSVAIGDSDVAFGIW